MSRIRYSPKVIVGPLRDERGPMTPSTPSGRRLLDQEMHDHFDAAIDDTFTFRPEDEIAADIVEVEREAVEAYRLALAEKVRAAKAFFHCDECWSDFRLRLRLIEGEKPDSQEEAK